MCVDEVPEAAQGVLLYYLYHSTRCKQLEGKRWYEELCTRLSLVGRVRIALDGINATVGGTMEALRLHIAAVTERYGGGKIDFKLAESRGRKSAVCASQSGFTSLKVQLCKEVVSTGVERLAGESPTKPDGARHVSPAEFHSMLAEAPAAGVDTVLLDCRNLYEARVGHFEAEGTTLLDPGTRTFSELPAWMEQHQGRLAGRRVLMYCTGGVRCETASAYLRSLGACFRGEGVVQLQGGIERYLEAFPSGGFFVGKNFVFDERVDVAPVEAAECSPVGKCLLCSAAWDDYASRQREEAAVDAGSAKHSAAMQQARPRRAWLLTPEQHASLQDAGRSGAACELELDSQQHLRQTEGWGESMAELLQTVAEQGPFDGVMGFSQGAAVAAVLFALQSEQPPLQPRWFNFAILCSAYPSAVPEHQALLRRARQSGGVPLPSLHIYSWCGDDRQVGASESEEVAESFDPGRRCCIRHGSGHLIPSTKAAAQRVRDFLEGVPV